MALGADQNLNIVVRLKDEATKGFQALKKNIDNAQKSIEPAAQMSKNFALALTGAATAAAGFGVMAVKSAMGAQVEMARFEATMKNVKGVTDASRQAILDRAQAVTKMGFDDEEAANSMAMLYQRTGDVNKAMELNNLAMDLARAKNIGLADASNMIGMVMSGNGRALKQYGIEISETLTPMEALGELQGKVAGQSEAFNQTLAGQGEQLKVAWGNFLETVGERLLPILTNLLQNHVIPFVQNTLPEWIEKMKEITKWFQEHQTVLILVAGAIGGLLVPAIISMGLAFAAAAVAAAPWLIGGAIIAGLVAGIVWLVKNWDMVQQKMAATWETIKGQFRAGINFLIGLAEGWANAYVRAANTIIGALNKIKVSVPDWVPGIGGKSFGINIGSVPNVSLPRMEHGGIVPGARGTEQPIIAHGGERVIPAGNVQRGGSGMNFYITINNPQVRNDDDIWAIRDQMDRAVRDLMRNHKVQVI